MDFKSLFGLEGEVAIVTGAAQGLGVNMARVLAEAGANVVIADINQEGGTKVAEEIKRKTGRECIAIRTDLTENHQVRDLVEKTVDRFGQVDVLVNNAAIVQGRSAEEITLEDWNRIMDVDLRGVFFCCQAAAKFMMKRKKGVIINISSMAAHIAVRPIIQAHYQAAKGGLESMTRALAAEWAPHNIRVNALMPGNMRSPVIGAHMSSMAFWMMRTPLNRLGEPEEVEGPILFLASKASSYMTGATLVVDGGFKIWLL